MRSLGILLFLALSACGMSPRVQNIDVGTKNPELTPYVEKFYANAKRFGIDTARFDATALGYDFNQDKFASNSTTLGICSTNGFQSRIYINPTFWNNRFSEIDKQTLMDHELSHCLMFRGHVSQKMTVTVTPKGPNSIPEEREYPYSLMHPYHVASHFFDTNLFLSLYESHYLAELFDYQGKPTMNVTVQFSAVDFKMDINGCESHDHEKEKSP